MSESQLPLWFPLQSRPIGKFKPTLAEIEEFIHRRSEIYDDLKNDHDFSKRHGESDAAYQERIAVDSKTITVMKMGIVEDLVYTNWFLEYEGDLFQYRFENALWSDKEKVLDFLFPDDEFGQNWMVLDDLIAHLGEDLIQELNIPPLNTRKEQAKKSQYLTYKGEEFGMQKMIALSYRYASAHLLRRNKRIIIYKGWVLLSLDRYSTTIKHRYQDLFQEDLDKLRERIKTEASGEIKRLRGQINDLIHRHISPKYSLNTVGSLNLEGTINNMILFPPCIQELLQKVDETGYLNHNQRLQLGLFLKHIGMGVDEQLRYWYERAVDNKGLSFEEFESRAGYNIRHLYGLEGSEKDYNMIACSKLQLEYYCTFIQRDVSGVKSMVEHYMKQQPGYDQARKHPIALQVIQNKEKSQPKMACAKYLEMTSNRTVKAITFPLQYVNIAAKSSGKLLETEPIPEVQEEEVTPVD
ncbi:MAG: hypothetical protein ACXAE3_06660 [Candidatus Kariarchaeaceae archaeon]|jgi:DNA primase large subunit